MVQPATEKDFDAIMALYAASRRFMRENGNADQWGDHFPPENLIREDIRCGRLYVCREEENIYGAFALIFGEDPTYAVMEDGAWRSSSPYATIHRVTGGKGRGVFSECLRYAKEKSSHLRIDTHERNLPMRHLIEKNGFIRCGIIHVADGTPRIAYEWLSE